MSNATPQIQPSDSLVEWVSSTVEGIAYPKDRPWFYIKDSPPKTNPGYWNYACMCVEHKAVRMRRADTKDKKEFLYLGQCRNCERIFWVYTDVEAPNDK